MEDTYSLLVEAIHLKKQVLAVYEDLLREMCPHVLGYKDSRLRCLFYQFAGKSSRRIYPLDHPLAYMNWRCLILEKLEDVTLRDGEWYSISKLTQAQTCVDQVIIEVSGWS